MKAAYWITLLALAGSLVATGQTFHAGDHVEGRSAGDWHPCVVKSFAYNAYQLTCSQIDGTTRDLTLMPANVRADTGQSAAEMSKAQSSAFRVGDKVDALPYGYGSQWIPCTVQAVNLLGKAVNSYSVRCEHDGHKLTYSFTPDHIRAATAEAVQRQEAEHALADASPGVRYGTREPMRCDSLHGRIQGTPNAAQVRQLIQCTMEHEGAGPHLYLMENIQVAVHPAHALNPDNVLDVSHTDPRSPYVPITGSLDQYQCDPIQNTYAVHNEGESCTIYSMPNAHGGCVRNSSGDWECNMADPLGQKVRYQQPPPRR
jgi:hypothetical protein